MRSRFSLVLTLLVSTTLLVTSVPAQAVVPEPQVSLAGGITFAGHGFGHGIGMSQYGAQGRALKNQTASQILGFYYPGTTLAQASGYIRVWLKGDLDSDTIVLPKSGLSIADYGKGKVYKLPTTLGAKAWKLIGSGFDSGFKVSYQNNGWHPYLPGGHALVGLAEFRNTTSFTVTVRMPGGDKSYRGAIRRSNSKTINRTGFDSYVKGVVAAEMPSTWRLEALKSQAIAARTYGASRLDTDPSSTWDVRDTTDDQVYGGMSSETTKTTQAVTSTAGQILTFGGEPADAKFSSSNGGWTVDGGTSYLPAQADTFEGYAGVLQTWHYTAPEATLKSKLAAYLKTPPYNTDIGTPQWVQVLARDGHGEWNGRVTSIKVHGTMGEITITGSAFRFALSLRSSWFQMS
jgi:stage II sporulation protein D